MSKCDIHDDMVKDFKTRFDKIDKKIEKHTEDIIKIKSDTDWLVNDRKEQKKAYENKIAWQRKIKYGIYIGLFTCLAFLFDNREVLRRALKDWLGC